MSKGISRGEYLSKYVCSPPVEKPLGWYEEERVAWYIGFLAKARTCTVYTVSKLRAVNKKEAQLASFFR